MFKIGDYVVNAKNGVCYIEDVQEISISGENKDYYLLIPQNERNAKIYIPVNNASQRMRLAMNEEQALTLIREMKTIKVLSVENERERESVYKNILKTCDPKSMVSIVKTIYLRRQDRLREGKKTVAVDEYYFKLAEKHLHGELAFALQISLEEVIQVIMKNLE